MIKNTQENIGFVAGTLVHTDKGLKPIQDIKVGDLILSSPKQGDGSVRESKKVIKNAVLESQEIVEIIIMADVGGDEDYEDEEFSEEDELTTKTIEHIFSTSKQPFYISWSRKDENSQIWQTVDNLLFQLENEDEGWFDKVFVINPKHKDQAKSDLYLISNLIDVQNGYALRKEGLEYINYSTLVKFEADTYDVLGVDIDYLTGFDEDYIIAGTLRNQEDLEEDVERILEVREYVYSLAPEAHRKFKTDVHYLEVEDYHTYFVGEQGLWVADGNEN